MNSVERVKIICKNRGIPISKLEKDLGFSNGYIGQLRKGSFPAERLELIASYLGLSVHFLLTGNNKKPASTSGDGFEKYALLNEENRAAIDALIDRLLASQSEK